VGGRLSLEVLRSFRVVEREPVSVRYREATVLTNAPPSSGGVLLARALGVHDRLGTAVDPVSSAWIRRAAAVLREAEELRTPALVHRILEGDGRELAAVTALDAAAVTVRERLGAPPEPSAEAPAARGTSHVSVVDACGNAAALTSSTGCGSGVFVAGTGLQLNNMLGEEDLTTNAADPRPGTRMTSMMSPTLVSAPGFEAVLGSSGSARIRSAIFRIVTALVDDGVGATEAVDLPRVHPTGRTLEVEAGFDADALDEARAAGEPVNAWPDQNIYFGGAQVAMVRGGRADAAGDPRRGGSGIVV
jgi:gamma-glutamyltranspeptidase/glutathione hydrolase